MDVKRGASRFAAAGGKPIGQGAHASCPICIGWPVMQRDARGRSIGSGGSPSMALSDG